MCILTESTGTGLFGGEAASQTSGEERGQIRTKPEAESFVDVEKEQQQEHDTDAH